MAATHQVSGDRIKQARLRAGMTQTALARAINTSERNIVRWETDRNSPRMEHVAAIAEATGSDISSLLVNGNSADTDDEESEAVADLTAALLVLVRQAVRQAGVAA